MADTDLETRADHGDSEAQCSLAFLFEIGLDRPQDYRKAAHYWQMAAKLGRQLAIAKLRALLDEGKIQASWLEENFPSTARKANEGSALSKIAAKVLMADDENEVRQLMAEILENAGYQVIHALNGEEAVQKVIANPDTKLIITDLKMPKLNGLQFVKAIRRMGLAESIRIIVMTAFSQPALIAEGKKLAIDAWLVKPVRQDALIETVNRLVERKNSVA